ncbi:MAG: PhzF family phenazine biosynthesis protein [Pseudomonadota bacterium]
MIPYAIYDVFTDKAYAGNPLAIVMEADGLSTEQMQTMAREFNLSETIFVKTPVDPANTAHVRIFFPTAEIPFAGHPTIGCALHLAKTRGLNSVTLEEVAGLVPVAFATKDTGLSATFTAPIVPHVVKDDCDKGLIAAALGLELEDFAPTKARTCTGGPTFLYAPLKSTEALAKAKPQEPAFSKMSAACGVDSIYLYTPDFEARMFAPHAGIPEDPATGSASALLAAQLHADGQFSEGTNSLTLHQGRDMGRLSSVGFAADVQDDALRAVRISGQAVCLAQGHIAPPPPHPAT